MNDHINHAIAATLHRFWPIPIDVDHFAREEAMRERAREMQILCHPDPRDPDYPGDDDEC